MQRVGNSRNPAKDKFGAGKNGFQGGDMAAGQAATTPGFEWFDSIQEELANVIEGAGIALDGSKFNQLFTAIGKIAGSSTLPAGAMVHYAGAAVPSGFLLANGAAISRTTYATLFAAIGTTYGAGDGSTTFNLPDGRGVFLRGLDNGRGLDTGRTLGSYQADSYASHSHTLTDPGHNHSITDPGHNHTYGGAGGTATSAGTGTGFGASNGSTGSATTNITIQSKVTGITMAASGGTETTPKNIATNLLIKY